jgi:PIN domain nuclease of toxin-antitoxin system
MPRIDHLKAAVVDTHVWIWASAGEKQAAGMAAFKGAMIVSAISVWEVAMLESKGRLRLKPDPETWIYDNLEAPVELEPISPAISIQSCQLPDFHGDPADRIIVATAMELGLPLITADIEISDWNKRYNQVQIMSPAGS